MKMLWCWRCKMEVPMLNEEEFRKAAELYKLAFRAGSMEERSKPLRDYYRDLTGWDESNPNAIIHHRISLYGLLVKIAVNHIVLRKLPFVRNVDIHDNILSTCFRIS